MLCYSLLYDEYTTLEKRMVKGVFCDIGMVKRVSNADVEMASLVNGLHNDILESQGTL